MKQQNKYAFTLVEMMIVIALLLMLLTFAYLPYAHYQEKLKIRQAIREASQTILGSRNLAINGYDTEIAPGDFTNRGLGVYFTTTDENYSQVFSYDIDHEITNLASATIGTPIKRKFPTGTKFEGVVGRDSSLDLGDPSFLSLDSNINGIVFYYYPITGESEYYSVDVSGTLTEITDNKIFLEFSYKHSTSPVLRKILQYDTRAHIIDYGIGVTEL